MDVANIIYNQLGGGRFVVMTGAKNFEGGDNYLRFNIGRNASKANTIKITLMPSDTYKVEFIKKGNVNISDIIRRSTSNEDFVTRMARAEKAAEPKTIKEYNDVYADMLEGIFTSVTGMHTRL